MALSDMARDHLGNRFDAGQCVVCGCDREAHLFNWINEKYPWGSCSKGCDCIYRGRSADREHDALTPEHVAWHMDRLAKELNPKLRHLPAPPVTSALPAQMEAVN